MDATSKLPSSRTPRWLVLLGALLLAVLVAVGLQTPAPPNPSAGPVDTGTIRETTVEEVRALDAGHGFTDDDGSLALASFDRDFLDPVRASLPDVPTNMPEGETTDVLVDVLAERSDDADRAGPAARYADQLDRARDLHEGPGWLLALLHAVTFLGDEEFYLVAFPVLYWSVSRGIGIRLGVMLLLTSGINAIGKLLVASPRPPFLDPSLERVPESTFGIPSGHAQNAVAVWGLLAAILRRWWSVLGAVVLAAAIGWSRVHLGAHFLEDVLVGWSVGAVLLAAFLLLERRVTVWALRLRPAMQVLAGVVASLALIVPGVVLSARLQGQQFPWPGMADPAATTGASAVVTPAATLAGLVVGLVVLHARGGFDSGGPVHLRLGRVAVGLVGVIVLWQGLGAVFPGGEGAIDLALRYVRYGLVGAWVGGLAPVLFVRLGLAAREGAPAPRPGVPVG